MSIAANPQEISRTLPDSDLLTDQTLESVCALPVLDVKGKSVPFEELFKSQKTIIVFIRHFFCGLCQAYVSELAKIPEASLDAASTSITVVGCGDWNLIENYKAQSGFKGPLYADPTANLHITLGLIKNIAGPAKGEDRKSYVPNNMALSVLGSIKDALKQPINAISGKGGNFTQLGGEFVLGPGRQCSFAHRMKNSMDHVETKDLMAVAGVHLP